MTVWHELTATDVLIELESNEDTGLSMAQIDRRHERYGSNELVELGGRGPLRIVWEQLSSAMVVLLVVAALVSVYLQEHVDAGAIFAIILLNAVLGFFQDYRAEKALAALKRLSVPTVKVRRGRFLEEISAKELVPGDIVLLDVGNQVPADCRLLESVNLRIQEASLTGESEPVQKHVEAIETKDLPLGDRNNMAYMTTLVTYGHGLAVVTDTGMNTELGTIADSLQTVTPRPTPLQRRLARLGRTLAVVSLVIVALVFVLGILVGESPRLMLMTALSLAVAIVPEGLPAVATVALALGARRMFKRRALIRKLPAVETLGSVTTICSDKTGTLTENRMTVTLLEVAGRRADLTQQHGSEDVTRPWSDDPQVAEHSAFDLLLAGAGLCNDAELVLGSTPGSFWAVGEPTEAALVVAAARHGLSKPDLTTVFPRIDEVPFDSRRKRMTTLHEIHLTPATESCTDRRQHVSRVLHHLKDVKHVAFMKGAVDAVLDACPFAWIDEKAQSLDDDHRQRILRSSDQNAASGMRVLGVAFRPIRSRPPTGIDRELEQDFIFVGMLGMVDPPRPEVKDAVARCGIAGIRPVMITGDHPLTALYIARQLGIADGQQVLVGRELSDLDDTDLEGVVDKVSVYARVAPTDKLRIVQALQNRNQVVAMTGDGVNDAPALKQAHIGVAMGRIGTDVAKEAADMVLLDDNFATIVNAVEEGRIAYDNIRKFVKYTMTSNAGEVWVMVLGPLLGMPVPLLPLQILWVNLVTDGLPGLALAIEPPDRGVMQRSPYPPDESVMGRGMWRDIAWVGLLMGVVSLALGYWFWASATSDERHWRTIVFTVLTMSQMGNSLAVRSARDSLFQIGLLSNKAMLGSVLLTFSLQLAVIYLPPLQAVFKTAPLSFGELLLCLLLSTVVFWAVEAKKMLQRS